MNRRSVIALTVVVSAALFWAVVARGAGSGIERLYVLDCGQNTGKDQSRWSPGVNEGKAIDFSDNCYLIRHAKGLLLWDTGVPDAVAAMPDGMVVANGAIVYRRAKTLVSQLAEIGVKPADVTYVAISHTHGDHVGNVGLFPTSTILIQGAEYDWAMTQPTCRLCRDARWVCEAHPDKPMRHDGCNGAGMPCPTCNAGEGMPELPPGFKVTVDAKHGGRH